MKLCSISNVAVCLMSAFTFRDDGLRQCIGTLPCNLQIEDAPQKAVEAGEQQPAAAAQNTADTVE